MNAWQCVLPILHGLIEPDQLFGNPCVHGFRANPGTFSYRREPPGPLKRVCIHATSPRGQARRAGCLLRLRPGQEGAARSVCVDKAGDVCAALPVELACMAALMAVAARDMPASIASCVYR